MLLQDLLSTPSTQTCIIDNDRIISYGELARTTDLFASELVEEHKIAKGDRVAVLLPNSWQFLASFYAILKAGAIPVPIDFRSSPREVSYYVQMTTASLLVSEISKKKTLFGEREQSTNFPFHSTAILEIDTSSQSDLPISSAKKSDLPSGGTEDDPACILFTGGTTGLSKGAVLTHRNISAVLSGISSIWMLRHFEETFAQILPMTHSGGLNCGANCAIFNGSKIVILRKFDPTQLLDLIEKHRVSVVAGVPTVYSALIHEPSMSSQRDLSSLRICLSSGAPLSGEIASRFQNMTGVKIVVGWGLTEASPQLTMCAPNTDFRPNYVGKPLPNTQVAALDETQDLLPKGNVGELAAKGPQIMRKYWMNDEETKKVFTGDGWLRTGDIGSVHSEGVYLFGRKKDVINSSGFKIWPHDVESVLLEKDEVREAAVVGVNDQDRGEIAVAFVVLKNEKITEEELMKFCKSRLTTYKVPRKFIFVESLPKSSVGKVLHRVLREQFHN